MDHENSVKLMDRLFVEGTLGPLEERALRVHLRDCESCRRRYDRLRQLELALAEPGSGAAGDLGARLLGPKPAESPRRSPNRSWTWIAPLAAAAATAAVFANLSPTDATSVSGQQKTFSARGGPEAATERQAWIRVFAKAPGVDRVRELANGATIAPRDGLMMAYTNRSTSPWRAMMIVGRDSRGGVHWYHPAYRPETSDAAVESLRVTAGVADRELREVIYNDDAYPPGDLTVCALFSHRPQKAAKLHSTLTKGRWPADGARDCRTLRVAP